MKDIYGNILECCIDLDPDKVFDAVRRGETVLGKPSMYWAGVLTDHAQELADEASPEQYEEWDIEALGYE